MVTPQPDDPQTPEPPLSLPDENFVVRFLRFPGHVALFLFWLAIGVFGQMILLFPFGGLLLHGGPEAGVAYALLCGIPGSFFLILALRRRREAIDSGITPNPLEQVALLGFASTALVYGICAGAIAVSPG